MTEPDPRHRHHPKRSRERGVEVMHDDNAKAEALRIASSGWKFTPEDVGSYAAKMLRALNEGLINER